jgi:hypothetical protein
MKEKNRERGGREGRRDKYIHKTRKLQYQRSYFALMSTSFAFLHPKKLLHESNFIKV